MRYKAIVEQIVTDIRENKLSSGQRMPSLRKLASQYEVSMTTALNSYRSLEASGWVVARPQSGFFVSNQKVDSPRPRLPLFKSRASTISVTNSARFSDASSHTSGPFGISQLSPNCIPVKALEKSIKRGMQSLGEQLHQYPDPQGLEELRYALSSHFTQNGFPFNAQDLVITGGCIDAVRLALEVTSKPGDAIAISSPCFNGLLELLANMNRKIVEIPCTEDGIDLTQLETHIKNGEVSAGLFSSSHMNPQGINLTLSQKQQLAMLANHYKVPVIEDDIYAELAYDKALPLPVKSRDKNGYVLWCGSISKSLSSGYRLGWCLPGRFQQDMVRHCRINMLGHNTVVQAGVADFIKTGQYRKHLNIVRGMLFENISSYQKLLQECLPDGSAISQPSGGMVLWIQVPGLNTDKLLEGAEKLNIEIRAGSFFTTRRLYRDCFRLNAGWALSDAYDENRSVEEALRQLLQLVHNALK
jgi:DNA-binding transcriptional MocR family regulator